jgi:hypothetical protein
MIHGDGSLPELLAYASTWNKHLCAAFPYDVLVFHEALTRGGQGNVTAALANCRSVAFHQLSYEPPDDYRGTFHAYQKMNQLLGCEAYFAASPLWKYKYFLRLDADAGFHRDVPYDLFRKMEEMDAAWATVGVNFRGVEGKFVLESFSECMDAYAAKVEPERPRSPAYQVYMQRLASARRHEGLHVLGGFFELGLTALLQSESYMRFCSFVYCTRGVYNNHQDEKWGWREQTFKTPFIWQNHGQRPVVVFDNLHVMHAHWSLRYTPGPATDVLADPAVVSDEAALEAVRERRRRKHAAPPTVPSITAAAAAAAAEKSSAA